MNCLPLANPLKRLGQILSKMWPQSSQNFCYVPLSTVDKENIPIDQETSSYFPSYGSTPSSSPDRYRNMADNHWWSPFYGISFREQSNNDPYATSRTYLSRSSCSNTSVSPLLSSSSSGFHSSTSDQQTLPMAIVFNDFKVFQDSLLPPSKSFNSTAEVSELASSQPNPIPPVTTPAGRKDIRDSWFDNELENIAASILADQSDEILEIRKEFEMNGKTTELDKFFSPSVSSTPVISRKSLKFDDSNSLVGENNVASRSPQYHHKSRKSSFQRKKVKPDKKSMTDHCVFCKNNGLNETMYSTHTVKDRNGRVSCPWLRRYKCPICGEDGDKAHTVKYCPKKPIITPEDLERMGNQPNEKHLRRI